MGQETDQRDLVETKGSIESTEHPPRLKSSVEEAIQRCNQSLTTQEIQDLNHILLWVACSDFPLDVKDLEAILFLRHGQSKIQLAKQIRDKYGTFLTVSTEDDSSANVTLKDDSMADYFKSGPEGQSTSEAASGRSRAGIAVDNRNAQALIALDCMRALIVDVTAEIRPLRNYARASFANHLEQIDLDVVDPNIKSLLGGGLMRMFRDPKVIQATTKGLSAKWSSNDSAVTQVLKLFNDPEIMSNVLGSDVEAQRWLKTVNDQANPEAALLEDVAKIHAKLWLTAEETEDVMSHLHWLYMYLNKMESSTSPREVARLTETLRDSDLTTDDVREVLAAAKAFDIYKDSDAGMLRNLGLTYQECEEMLAAIDTLSLALEKDPNHMKARSALAQTYARKTQDGPTPDWTEAIRHQDILIERLRNGDRLWAETDAKETLDECLLDKAYWLRDLHRYDAAIVIYEDLLGQSSENDDVRLDLICVLREAESFTEIVKITRALNSKVDPVTKRTLLSTFFWTFAYNEPFHAAVTSAFQQTDSFPELYDYYQSAIDDIKKAMESSQGGAREKADRYYMLTYWFGLALYNHGSADQQQEGIRHWEFIVAAAKNDTYLQFYVGKAVDRLVKVYFADAIEDGSNPAIAARLADKLKGFVKGEEDDWTRGLAPAAARSLLARYYCKVGDVDKAREHLRPDVKLSLKMVSNEDPENKYSGYSKLAGTLMKADDEENAIAAWSLIQPNPEPAPPLFRTKHKREGPLYITCEGRCGTNWSYADDFYVCRECFEVQFDAECLVKLRSGTLKYAACGRNHEFMHVPRWTPESEERARAGKVRVGEQDVSRDEWLAKIRRDWNLPHEDFTAP